MLSVGTLDAEPEDDTSAEDDAFKVEVEMLATRAVTCFGRI